jgi:hypothetical protein
LQTRELIARRFREEHQSVAANGTDANVYPYFVGVFDTVAALLNPKMSILLLCMFIGLDVIASWLLVFVSELPLLGKFVTFVGSFWSNFLVIVRVTFLMILVAYVFTHFKFDFSVPGYSWRQCLFTMHFTELYQKFYDYTLNPNIAYAKHAISIDENRKDFKRVGWDPGDTDRPARDEQGNIFFEQVWFPGNHADIGGGYEENESRLSDATLQWILIAATVIPNPIKIDFDVVKAYPVPVGRSHNEVKAGFGLITKLTGLNWAEERRELPSSSATMHKSVCERFDAIEAFEYDEWVPYRPQTLRTHVDFARFYEPEAPFPATSLSMATALADDPESRQTDRSV